MTAAGPRPAWAWLIAWPNRHPGLAFVLLVLLAVVGTVFAARLLFSSSMTTPSALLQVHAELPGIDALSVEALVAQPIEQSLRGVPSQAVITRTTLGETNVTLRMASSTERDRLLESVRRQVAGAMAHLPVGMEAPTVEARDSASSAAAVYIVTADQLTPELTHWVEQGFAGPLRELPEVASVAVTGASEHEILIQPDLRRMVALGLTIDDIALAARRGNEMPRTRRVRRAITPGSIEAIAARAVRLPSGEPIALAEVARTSTVVRESSETRQYFGAPALQVAVYARNGVDGLRAAERAHAHLAWLRANDLIPSDAAVTALRDRTQVAKQRLKLVATQIGIFLLVLLMASVIFFGIRRCGFLVCAFAVWLPACAGLLWAFGFTLESTSACGLIFAAGVFALLTLSSAFEAIVGISIVAMLLAWLANAWLGKFASAVPVYAFAVVGGLVIAWLLTPWSASRKRKTPLLLRLLPEKWHPQREPVAVTGMATVALIGALIGVRALAAPMTDAPQGSVRLRLHGDSFESLTTLGEQLLPAVRQMVGAEGVTFSARGEEGWRLQLDQPRAEQFGVTLSEVGRALAVAREGWVIGEIAYRDTVYRLRLKLPRGVAGAQFERLPLRGESGDQSAVYFRDVGLALSEIQPHERLRIDGKPAVEVTGRWQNAEQRIALERWCRTVTLPEGYRKECRVREAE